jgi:hypothetical protein
VSKTTKKIRRDAVSAGKSRVAEVSILAIGAALLAPYAISAEQDQDAAATNTAEAKSESDLTEILVTGIRKALATSQEIKKESDTGRRLHHRIRHRRFPGQERR